jgi:hypothetical protein
LATSMIAESMSPLSSVGKCEEAREQEGRRKGGRKTGRQKDKCKT